MGVSSTRTIGALVALIGALASASVPPRVLHSHSRVPVSIALPPQHARSASARAAALPPRTPLGSPLEYRDELEESMRRGEWRLGLALYEQCEQLYGACMSSVTHAALVTVAVNGLLRAGRVQIAASLLLATLLRAAREGAGGGGLATALELGHTHALLDACASTPGHMREAQAIVRALLAANATVDAKTYCILIKGFGRNGDARGVSTTLRAMRAAGVPPDLVTCNAALDAYARSRAPDEARALLRSMEEAPSDAALASCGAAVGARQPRLPAPNARSFNAVLKALAIAGQVDDARALAERMGGSLPVVRTASASLAAPAPIALPTQPANGAPPVKTSMPTRASRPQPHAADAADGALHPARAPPAGAAGAAAASRATAAAAAAAAGAPFNQVSLNTLIAAYARAGEIDTALALLDGGGADGYIASGAGADARGGTRVRAGAHAYTSILVALTRARRLADALLLFEHMAARGVRATAVSYNCLIAACARAGDDGRATKLLNAMRAQGGELAPDAQTYNALIAGLCRSAHMRPDALERVLALVREMEAAAISPNARTYNALLGALARRGDGRGAAAIAARMEEAGVPFTVHTYTVLLAAHGGAGDLPAVQDAWTRLLASGLTVDGTAWREFLRACLLADERGAGGVGGAGGAGQRGGDAPSPTAERLAAGAAGGRTAAAGSQPRVPLGAQMALDALDEMRRGAGECAPPISPDVVTYAILVHGLARTRAGAVRAWGLYGRMRAEGVQLDEPCARSLMLACKRFVGVEAAAQLLVDLQRDGWSERALAPLERELHAIEKVARYTIDERWKDGEAAREAARASAMHSGGRGGERLQMGSGMRGAAPRQRDALFERHGWNEFENGFRVL
ncbi:hypothetical protein KFE25_003459 [Diacronema lutheri]|uniref:PROP1-like PPR domain-containing protein n=1 Tax=Diacronema lutheri TaxID=2081491 RepID=A0A8J5X9Q3_DIALT|nr:hypothetical protein KFE25_003459 [Diacronema lutheri]